MLIFYLKLLFSLFVIVNNFPANSMMKIAFYVIKYLTISSKRASLLRYVEHNPLMLLFVLSQINKKQTVERKKLSKIMMKGTLVAIVCVRSRHHNMKRKSSLAVGGISSISIAQREFHQPKQI